MPVNANAIVIMILNMSNCWTIIWLLYHWLFIR